MSACNARNLRGTQFGKQSIAGGLTTLVMYRFENRRFLSGIGICIFLANITEEVEGLATTNVNKQDGKTSKIPCEAMKV